MENNTNMPDEPGMDITEDQTQTEEIKGLAEKPTGPGKDTDTEEAKASDNPDPGMQERFDRLDKDTEPRKFAVNPLPEAGQNPWFLMSVVRSGHLQVRCRGMVVPGAGVFMLVESTNLINGDVQTTGDYMEGYRLAPDGQGGAFLESIHNLPQPGERKIDPDQATHIINHPPGHEGDNGEVSTGPREVPARQENHVRKRPAGEAGGLGALMTG